MVNGKTILRLTFITNIMGFLITVQDLSGAISDKIGWGGGGGDSKMIIGQIFSHFFTQNIHKSPYKYTRFFCKQHLFLAQPQSCLTFSGIELQMLLRCCLIHISSIILRHFLDLLYLGLGLFKLYLYVLFFIFIFIFIMIFRIIS